MPISGPVRRTGRVLSHAQEDYLKEIYGLSMENGRVPTSELAERLRVSQPSVTEMMGKLAALGLVGYDRYRGAVLTDAGEAVALEIVRHHRLIETYLVRFLGYSWDEVHEEAERLEHVISERMEARLFESLGCPRFDPHGDPIPSSDGDIEVVPARTLADCGAGQQLEVKRVSDRDPGKLQALHRLGLVPGINLTVLEESRYESPVSVRVGRRKLAVALGLARVVYVA